MPLGESGGDNKILNCNILILHAGDSYENRRDLII